MVCMDIDVCTLISNLFMMAHNSGSPITFISYKRLRAIGTDVQHQLKNAIFTLNRSTIAEVYNHYPQFFEESVVNNQRGVQLKDGQYSSMQKCFICCTPSIILAATHVAFQRH